MKNGRCRMHGGKSTGAKQKASLIGSQHAVGNKSKLLIREYETEQEHIRQFYELQPNERVMDEMDLEDVRMARMMKRMNDWDMDVASHVQELAKNLYNIQLRTLESPLLVHLGVFLRSSKDLIDRHVQEVGIIEAKEMVRMKKKESVSKRAEPLCCKIVEAEKELYTLRHSKRNHSKGSYQSTSLLRYNQSDDECTARILAFKRMSQLELEQAR